MRTRRMVCCRVAALVGCVNVALVFLYATIWIVATRAPGVRDEFVTRAATSLCYSTDAVITGEELALVTDVPGARCVVECGSHGRGVLAGPGAAEDVCATPGTFAPMMRVPWHEHWWMPVFGTGAAITCPSRYDPSAPVWRVCDPDRTSASPDFEHCYTGWLGGCVTPEQELRYAIDAFPRMFGVFAPLLVLSGAVLFGAFTLFCDGMSCPREEEDKDDEYKSLKRPNDGVQEEQET